MIAYLWVPHQRRFAMAKKRRFATQDQRTRGEMLNDLSRQGEELRDLTKERDELLGERHVLRQARADLFLNFGTAKLDVASLSEEKAHLLARVENLLGNAEEMRKRHDGENERHQAFVDGLSLALRVVTGKV
ncbi:MAG: hypothetical protein NUW02_02150 [Candidatus Campbellbacteria bacterium]|nr:hypothetical protein [Candidatus Campbellbacteria bacterium]